jgi:hypothetical protein
MEGINLSENLHEDILGCIFGRRVIVQHFPARAENAPRVTTHQHLEVRPVPCLFETFDKGFI